MHRFYMLEPDAPLRRTPEAPEGLRVTLWRPSILQTAPAGETKRLYLLWWFLHQAHLFANREFSVLAMHDGERLVHRTGVFPRYLRFPFMTADDLQIGDTWTHPAYRGRGLARFAITDVVRRMRAPGRRFWYLVESGNGASIRVIEQCGFAFLGEGKRRPRWGLDALSVFHLEHPLARTP